MFATMKRVRIAIRRGYKKSLTSTQDDIGATLTAWMLACLAWMAWQTPVAAALLATCIVTMWSCAVPAKSQLALEWRQR